MSRGRSGRRRENGVERGGDGGEISGPIGGLVLGVSADLKELHAMGVVNFHATGRTAAWAVREATFGLVPVREVQVEMAGFVGGAVAGGRPEERRHRAEREQAGVAMTGLQDEAIEVSCARE